VEIFNPMGMPPLIQAVSHGDPQMVNLILSAGADVNVTSGAAGRTALMIACFRGQMDIARQLIDCGARWDICDRSDGILIQIIYCYRDF
jgi:ankyrin repeat protein